ncbi:MAG: ATP-dependent zinc protease family protein [Gammaproteobacteria bacterium]
MKSSVHAGLGALLASLCLVEGCDSAERSPREKSVTLGRVEYVVMEDVRMKLKARIDTGAAVSSIDAKVVEIKPAPNGSGEQVIFQIKDNEGNIKTIERTIVEWAKIKGKRAERAVRRPVVRLDLCLGGKRIEGRINLADRKSFLYPVLIGRNILETGEFVIDPRQKFMEKPGCSTN